MRLELTADPIHESVKRSVSGNVMSRVRALGDAVKERLRRRRVRGRSVPWFALAIAAIFVFVAIFAPFVAPHSPLQQRLTDRLKPPAWVAGGSLNHILGTDELGRDLLSRIIFGTRIAFGVAIATLVLGGGIGGLLGLLAGYYRGRSDTIIMRAADGTLSLPVILVALLFAITIGPGFGTVVLAIGIIIWAQFARLIRGEVLSLRERDWVKQAQINGASDMRILFTHIVPHVLNTWVVMASLQIGFIILYEASLSFLGAGIPPPEPAWGSMVAGGRNLVTTAWWISIFPGFAIMLLVLSFNLLGDWLREVLDPKLRQI